LKEIEEVQEISTKNVLGLLERQENIKDLCSKSEALKESSKRFAEVSLLIELNL